MKFNKGNWVFVTKRSEGAPDSEFIGKVVEATPDYAVAECRTPNGPMRFTMSDDTASIVFFRRVPQNYWNRRGC